jgi:predicted phage terminase large subunit-like protein
MPAPLTNFLEAKYETTLSSKSERAKKAVLNPFIIRREINNRSLFEFIKYFWDEISSDEFKPNWHIPFLCSELQIVAERVAKRLPKEYDLIINIPPGTTKTTIVSIMFPVWCWTKWFDLRFITASYSRDLSLESAEKSRDIIQSDKFKLVYPDLAIREDKNTKGNYKIGKKVLSPLMNGGVVLKSGGNRFSTSVGGTLIGFHGHINIVDDPLDPRRAASDVELKSANDWSDQTLSSRKSDKKATTLIMVMQRLHQNDPTGNMLRKKGKKIKHISLPGEIKEYEKYVNPPELVLKYSKDGLLDPIRLGWEELAEMKADFGQYGYAGQVGQNPTPPGGGMFKVGKFGMVRDLPPPNHIFRIIRYWDKAGTQGGGAFTAGVKMARLRDGKFLVIDVVRGQWGTDGREDIIRDTAELDGRNVMIWLEQEPGSGGKESVEATRKNLAGFSTRAERPTGDKIFRADPYSVQVNLGNVYLLEGTWNEEFVEEHRFFPFSTYKDQVDAAAGAFNQLAGKRLAKRIT